MCWIVYQFHFLKKSLPESSILVPVGFCCFLLHNHWPGDLCPTHPHGIFSSLDTMCFSFSVYSLAHFCWSTSSSSFLRKRAKRPHMTKNVFILSSLFLIIWLGIEFWDGNNSPQNFQGTLPLAPRSHLAIKKSNASMIFNPLHEACFFFSSIYLEIFVIFFVLRVLKFWCHGINQCSSTVLGPQWVISVRNSCISVLGHFLYCFFLEFLLKNIWIDAEFP